MVTEVPHRADYDRWRSRLSEDDYQAIRSELLSKIEGGGIHTSSWIPGSEWSGTPFMPIYEKACKGDQAAAAKCFGLILWEVMMDHEDKWSFGRYEKDGVPIEGLSYFKIGDDTI